VNFLDYITMLKVIGKMRLKIMNTGTKQTRTFVSSLLAAITLQCYCYNVSERSLDSWSRLDEMFVTGIVEKIYFQGPYLLFE